MEYLHCAVDLGQISVGYHLWWLIANANLETSRAPVHKLDGSLGFDGRYSSVHFFRHNIPAIEQASGHVFSVARITFDHLVGRFEAGRSNLLDGIGLITRLRGRNDRGVSNEWEMDSRIRHKVGLKLVKINVERAIESKRCCDR